MGIYFSLKSCGHSLMVPWGSLDSCMKTPELLNVAQAYRIGFGITRNGFFCIEYEKAALQEEVHHLHSLETILREMEERAGKTWRRSSGVHRHCWTKRAQRTIVCNANMRCVSLYDYYDKCHNIKVNMNNILQFYFHNVMYFQVKQDIQSFISEVCGHFVHRRFR